MHLMQFMRTRLDSNPVSNLKSYRTSTSNTFIHTYIHTFHGIYCTIGGILRSSLSFLAGSSSRNGRIVSPQRPLTLLDQRIFTHNQFDELKKPQDSWGRSAAFCHYPSSSSEIENENENDTDDGNGNGDDNNDDNMKMNISNHGEDRVCEGGDDHDCSSRILKQFLDTHYQFRKEDRKYIRHRAAASASRVPYERIIQDYESDGACIESSLL